MRKRKSSWAARAAAVACVPLLAAGAAVAAAGPAFAGAPYTCDTTSSTGGCGPYTNPSVVLGTNQTDEVAQDEWNAGSSEGTVNSQELKANSSSDWQVTANMTGDGAVLTSPEDQVTPQNWTGTTNLPVPLADYSSIKSTYDVTLPSNPGPSDDYEAMYDIWLGDATQQQWTNDQEIMVWTDNHNQTPAGTDTGKTWTDASTGAVYEIWVDSGGGTTTLGPDDIVSFEAKNNSATGSVDLYALFNFLKSGGYSTGSIGIDQVTFGFELCSTSGQDETFTVNSYTISAAGDGQNGAPGGGSGGGQQAPAVTTGSATSVTSTGATLNGSVNPEGADASYKFDWGTTSSYGNSTAAGDAGSGSSSVNESATLTGLQPSTTYHYRIESTNSGGTGYGSDQTFTTPASGGGGGPGKVAYDASSKAKATALSLSWTHTVGSGSDRALLVQGTVGVNGDTNCSQTMTDNGNAMTKLAIVHADNQNDGFTDVWGIADPPSGANTLKLQMSGACAGGTPTLTAGAISFIGVSQSAPFGAAVAAYGSGSSASVALSTASSSDLVGAFTASGSGGESAKSPLTSRYVEDDNDNSGAGNSAAATAPATGSSVTAKWGIYTDYWAAAAVEVQHD